MVEAASSNYGGEIAAVLLLMTAHCKDRCFKLFVWSRNQWIKGIVMPSSSALCAPSLTKASESSEPTNSPPEYHYLQSPVHNPDTPMRPPQPVSPLYRYFDGDRYLRDLSGLPPAWHGTPSPVPEDVEMTNMPSPAPADVEMADSPSVWQGALAPSGDESSPMEEDELDDNAPNTSVSSNSGSEGFSRYNLRHNVPARMDPDLLSNLYGQITLSPKSSAKKRPRDSTYAPSCGSKLSQARVRSKRSGNQPARRRFRDAKGRFSSSPPSSNLSNEPSIANSSGLRPFLTTPRSPLANTQTDLSRQTAANTFLNAFANSAGDLPPFSFAAPLLVDPALMAEPLPTFAETFHHYLSSTNNLTSEDPLLQYCYSCACVSRLLKHFLDVYTPAPEYARIVSQMTEALELADAWHLATCPLFPPLNVTSGYA
ncbi:hypothetical protein PCASD_02059 [Puccinia coronata f. sp. avenae]|uniref:Uncharacterized protein n=1 Tax=Puccinia coronata f. sp. avenae TaxID=200324 RepID=A0A2N5VQ84_9BASI|nr:hypothetical protein PCASD_02059 [Puccinia coronata f. sp. avenae]